MPSLFSNCLLSDVGQKYEQKAARIGEVWIVRCLYSPKGLWLVHGLEQVQELMKGGIPRHAIWPLAEVQNLLEPAAALFARLRKLHACLRVSAPTKADVGLDPLIPGVPYLRNGSPGKENERGREGLMNEPTL